jgi:hypothetical protein
VCSLLRRVSGRPLELVDRRPFPPLMTSEEIAYRIGLPETVLPGTRLPELPVGPEASARPVMLPVLAVVSGPPVDARLAPVVEAPGIVRRPRLRVALGRTVGRGTGRLAPSRSGVDDATVVRHRLIRDAGATLAGLGSVAVLVIALFPASSGGVLSAIATPDPQAAAVAPVGVAGDSQVAASPGAAMPAVAPSAVATSPVDQGATDQGATDGSSPISGPPADPGTPRGAAPAPTASAKPGPSPTRTQKPDATPLPTPVATPVPDPDATPSPTPEPTSMPTPDPTLEAPDPTPSPTPDPTPSPTPEPTPEPTPDPTPEP